MEQLSINTKKEVLSFLLNTVAVRLIAKNKLEKSQPNNPCYCCLKAFLDSVKTP